MPKKTGKCASSDNKNKSGLALREARGSCDPTLGIEFGSTADYLVGEVAEPHDETLVDRNDVSFVRILLSPPEFHQWLHGDDERGISALRRLAVGFCIHCVIVAIPYLLDLREFEHSPEVTVEHYHFISLVGFGTHSDREYPIHSVGISIEQVLDQSPHRVTP